MIFHRGDIVKVNLNPTKGHEQGEYRPVLVGRGQGCQKSDPAAGTICA
ncbi:MAG: type II toxin-antitoxin system PemK/MazF family toxin [Lachnospiraceae bacterium]|nr:type II toxin-antitoxin system PemK/MazF family toxin [Lachnospiraceae bacterium]